MKKLNLLLLFAAVILLLPACRSAKDAGNADIKLKQRSSKYVLKKLAKNRVEAEWLSAKAKVTYKDDNETRKFTTNIRYRRDSVIWFNVKKASVEAVRVQITPDSFFLINRLDKEYFANSIAKIEEQFNLPQRTAADISVFDLLQEMLLGNPVFFANSDLKAEVDKNEYVLKGTPEHFDSEYRIDGVDFMINAMNFEPDDGRQYLNVELERDRKKEEYPNFSYFRKYKLNNPQRGDVELKLKITKLELDIPKTIRFEIPKNYTLMD